MNKHHHGNNIGLFFFDSSMRTEDVVVLVDSRLMVDGRCRIRRKNVTNNKLEINVTISTMIPMTIYFINEKSNERDYLKKHLLFSEMKST
jgi:hypothetical protein